MKKLNIALILIIVGLLAVTTPVAAVTIHVDLGKTYKSHLMNVSAINVIDLWKIGVTKSQLLTTEGDGSDIQTLHNPTFQQVTRNFSTTTGTFHDITVTISGSNPSTQNWKTLPAQKFYIKPVVPTIRQQIPKKIGNPMLTKVNETWNNETPSQGLFLASKDLDIYKTGGILNINTSTDSYTNIGSFSAADYNKSDFVYTLTRNRLSVTDFESSALQSRVLGEAHPEMKVDTGSWFLSTIKHNDSFNVMNVYSVYRVVALKAKTNLTWKNNTGTFNKEQYTYFKGFTDQAVVLSFTGTNPDINKISNVTYLILNRTANYDVRMDIDTDKLAESAESRWQNSLTGGQVIDILYKTLNNDNKLPFSYTMKVVGTAASPSTAHSNIAITPGYGISGNARAKTIAVPSTAIESLAPGYYDIYLMGTDINNDVVALDQKTLRVEKIPKVTSISPKMGPLTGGTLVTITGTNLTGATAVMFNSLKGTSVTVVSSTKITVKAPAHAAGPVHVRVTTAKGTSPVVAGDKFKYT